jgi:hypothetical protein
MKDNQFNDPKSDGVQAGAPKGNKTKSTKKIRMPRVKDQREIDLLATQSEGLVVFKASQARARKDLRLAIRLETHPPKPSRVERIAASLKPEEKAALLAALQPN